MSKSVSTRVADSKNKCTQVDTLSEQVDTGPSFQNSQFAELGQQVDTLSEQAGNQAAAWNGAGDLHRNFRSLNPPRFSGSPDPDEAENWKEEIERIFQVMQCINREKVVLATFQLTKDARAWWKATSAHLPNVAELEWAGFLEVFRVKYFSKRVKENKAAEFAALKQKGMSVAEYEAQFARLAVYTPHLVGTERLKANRFMDGLRPMFIERLGPHNIQTYTEMVQRAQLVEDTMAKVEGMRGKDISKPTFTKRGAVDTTGTFPNNNNNNNKRPTIGKNYGMEKKIKVEEAMTVEYCKFCNKPGHQADECWKKAGACLRCGSHEHRIPNCPMLKDQDGRNQGGVKRPGRVNAITQAELPEGGHWLVVAAAATVDVAGTAVGMAVVVGITVVGIVVAAVAFAVVAASDLADPSVSGLTSSFRPNRSDFVHEDHI
ncbi:hypothetical protein Taro_040643 [Colocasia esculenta]|uniref:CCHC-type domain-containing protein n=1 Tax=Colocasia esculenta TaxID=4460 RepID=A0A843WJJ6_COLES|nr:hypothetical protein [Colocasia esculenta]